MLLHHPPPFISSIMRIRYNHSWKKCIEFHDIYGGIKVILFLGCSVVLYKTKKHYIYGAIHFIQVIFSAMEQIYKQKNSERLQFGKVGIENQLLEPQARLKSNQNTLFYSIPKIWNQKVTPEQAKVPSVDAFKQHFKRNTICF